jgi:hypothetical protein
MAAGPVKVGIGFEFHNVPEYMVGSLTEDVKATAISDTGKQIFCVQLHQIGVAGPAFMQAGAAADRPNGGSSMNANGLLRGTSNSPPSQLAAPSFTDLDTTNETSAVAEKVNKSNLDADQKVAVANTTSAHGSLRGASNSLPSFADLGTSNETFAVADEVNKSKLGFLGTDEKVAGKWRGKYHVPGYDPKRWYWR